MAFRGISVSSYSQDDIKQRTEDGVYNP